MLIERFAPNIIGSVKAEYDYALTKRSVNLSTGILNSEAASETVSKTLWGPEHTTVNGIRASLTFSDGRRRSGAKCAYVTW